MDCNKNWLILNFHRFLAGPWSYSRVSIRKNECRNRAEFFSSFTFGHWLSYSATHITWSSCQNTRFTLSLGSGTQCGSFCTRWASWLKLLSFFSTCFFPNIPMLKCSFGLFLWNFVYFSDPGAFRTSMKRESIHWRYQTVGILHFHSPSSCGCICSSECFRVSSILPIFLNIIAEFELIFAWFLVLYTMMKTMQRARAKALGTNKKKAAIKKSK